MDQFLQQIFVVIHQIPVGRVSTYGAIAKMAGYPAMHAMWAKRWVIYLRGVSYLGFESSTAKQISLQGEDFVRQRQLLLAEGIEVSDTGKISLRKYQWQL